MKNGLSKYRDGRSDRCTSTMLSVGVLMLCAVMLSIGVLREAQMGTDFSAGFIAQESTRPAKHADLEWYIRSGQWRADIRSLAAAIQYLSEQPVRVAQTNGPVIKADNV